MFSTDRRSSGSDNARYIGLAFAVAVATAAVIAVTVTMLRDEDGVGAPPSPVTIAVPTSDRAAIDDGAGDTANDRVAGVEETQQPKPVESTPDLVPASGPLSPIAAVASSTRAAVPQLRCGGSNRFDAELLIDGSLDLGWGPSAPDGTGEWVRLDFGGPVVISEIGLTPGYLRVAPRQSEGCADVSAFGFNRFVNSVRYQLDDGSSIEHAFLDQAQIQWMTIEPTATRYVLMEITATSQRIGADDDTILSEIEFRGFRE